MKRNISRLHFAYVLLIGGVMLASCENPMAFETIVHEDGSLDKTIVFEKNDSALVASNVFGISASNGWTVEAKKIPGEKKNEDEKENFHIRFQKHFNSVGDANEQLNQNSDTLFQIKSGFEKKFRWFYTYIKYTETYSPINRFKMLPATDYVNQEDFQFIERLPNEGGSISRADSVFLQSLNTKIYDLYANTAIFNEQYDILTKLVLKYDLEKKWMDTLKRKRDYLFSRVESMKGETSIALEMADTLGIPLPKGRATADALELSRDFNSRLSFMTFVNDAKFKNAVTMPWPVVKSNADSVAGNKLFWRPLVAKFLFKEYTMYAESRKLNVWACIITVIVLGITTFAWARKKRPIK